MNINYFDDEDNSLGLHEDSKPTIKISPKQSSYPQSVKDPSYILKNAIDPKGVTLPSTAPKVTTKANMTPPESHIRKANSLNVIDDAMNSARNKNIVKTAINTSPEASKIFSAMNKLPNSAPEKPVYVVKKDGPQPVTAKIDPSSGPAVITKDSKKLSVFGGGAPYKSDAGGFKIDPFKVPTSGLEPDPAKKTQRDWDAASKARSSMNFKDGNGGPRGRDIGAEWDEIANPVPKARVGVAPGERDIGEEFDRLQNPDKYKGVPEREITQAEKPKEIPYARVNPPKPVPAPPAPAPAPPTVRERLKGLRLPQSKDEAIGMAKDAGKAVSDFAQTPTGNAVAGVAAGALAIKLISDALKKKEWYNEKCQGISNARKKAECLNYVSKRMRGDLKKKLRRCKYSNNPSKCESIIMDKLNSM